MGIYERGRPKKYDAINDTGKIPPKVAGEYRVRDKDGNLKYLGISNDINRRIKEHKKTGKINADDRIVEWRPVKPGTPYEKIKEHERKKIKEKHPYDNKAPGGEGPYPKTIKYYGAIPNGTSQKKKKGCYVATCVYGSYDCPEVWTLRRYRDCTLSRTVFGRCFIHLYYVISPVAVKLFGRRHWFVSFFKNRLDRMVIRLNDQGYDNDPYVDSYW